MRVGNHTITIKENLGKGSFGEVYRCVGPDNSIMAMKCTKLDPNGIQDLLEASIMSTYRHPNLCSALMAYSDFNYLYIFMEEAFSDLSRVIYSDENDDPFDSYTVTMWCHGMA